MLFTSSMYSGPWDLERASGRVCWFWGLPSLCLQANELACYCFMGASVGLHWFPCPAFTWGPQKARLGACNAVSDVIRQEHWTWESTVFIASLLFVWGGCITLSLKSLSANTTLRSGLGEECSGLRFRHTLKECARGSLPVADHLSQQVLSVLMPLPDDT